MRTWVGLSAFDQMDLSIARSSSQLLSVRSKDSSGIGCSFLPFVTLSARSKANGWISLAQMI
jgi:hypothetical protein